MLADADPARLKQLERAFRRLRPKHQQIILLARVEGLSYAEIARRLGITVAKAEQRTARTVAALDRALDRPGRPGWWFW